MNLLNSAMSVLAATPPLQEILIGFLVVILVLAVLYGILWAIENWIHPIPPPVKLILAIVLMILVVIWALKIFTV